MKASKKRLFWSVVFLLACDFVNAQIPCCGGNVLFNATNLPTGVLPVGTTCAGKITVGSGTSGFITTSPGATTTLSVTVPFNGSPEIIFDKNFRTNIGSGGVFSVFLIQACGMMMPQSAADSSFGGMGARLSGTLQLQVYPTVSPGPVTVTGSSADLGNADLLLVDESGRAVYHLHNDANTTVNLNLGQLANGLYFLRISNGSGVKTQKIIISH